MRTTFSTGDAAYERAVDSKLTGDPGVQIAEVLDTSCHPCQLRATSILDLEAAQQSGQNGVVVRVVDDGVGIPEQLQSQLFSPFVSTKEDIGTGLGLWVGRSILEKHGGTIHLNSAEPDNRGTTVSIFLPLKAASPKRHS